jgi:hypothetical protein
MRASHDLEKITMSFDEPNLVPNAGLLAPALLAQKLGIAELVDARVRLPAGRAGRASCGAKALTVLGGLLAGADSIDDLDVLRCGAVPEVFDDLRAPSTIGTWLRGFDSGTVRQLDAVSRTVLARAWAAGCGRCSPPTSRSTRTRRSAGCSARASRARRSATPDRRPPHAQNPKHTLTPGHIKISQRGDYRTVDPG